MPDAETYSEFIARYKAVAAMREAWVGMSHDPVTRDIIFPPDVQPWATWSAASFASEDEAVAAGMAALWP